MDERLQFVARHIAGEPMAQLCREFGISRKTGYQRQSSVRQWSVMEYQPRIFCKYGSMCRIIQHAAKIKPTCSASEYFPRSSIRHVHEWQSRVSLIRQAD